VSGERVRQIYGSTELSPAATIMPANPDEPRGSVGLPIRARTIEFEIPEMRQAHGGGESAR